MAKEPFSVLMAEDDEHDIIAARRAWKKHKISNPLYIVNDGEECLDFLYCRGKYKDRETTPQVGILLLDINMPKMDGLSVLKHIKNDENMRSLPVVILTTSKNETDRVRGYDLGANALVHVQRERDLRRASLVRKKTCAFKVEFFRVDSRRECVIRSHRTERRHPTSASVLRALKQVLELADLVATVQIARVLVVFDENACRSFRQRQRMA